jgi:hypothetical protein
MDSPEVKELIIQSLYVHTKKKKKVKKKAFWCGSWDISLIQFH